jgi:hypothetical protein
MCDEDRGESLLMVLKSRYGDILGPEIVEEICDAGFRWLECVHSCDVNVSALKSVVRNPDFEQIVDIHLRMKEKGHGNQVPDFILDLINDTGNPGFLIIYIFITGVSPDLSWFCGHHVGSSNIPVPKLEKEMREQGLGLEFVSDRILELTLVEVQAQAKHFELFSNNGTKYFAAIPTFLEKQYWFKQHSVVFSAKKVIGVSKWKIGFIQIWPIPLLPLKFKRWFLSQKRST